MVKLFKGLVLAAVVVSFTVFGSIAKAADPIRIPVLKLDKPNSYGTYTEANI